MAGGVPSLTQSILNEVPIPLPPLPVQQEIVRILDNFTELTTKLTTELTTELTARKKQYEYYKKSFLSQSSTAFVTKLGEVATLKTGSKPKEIFGEKDKFEYINAGTSNSGYVRSFNCEEHCSGKGATHTKLHKPIKMVYHEQLNKVEEAVNGEKYLKSDFGREWLKRWWSNE